MKKLILLMALVLILLASNSWAIFGIEKIPALIGEMSAVKVDVAKNADSIMKVNATMNARIDKVETNVNARISAVDKSQNLAQTAGRDIRTSTKNSDAVVIQMLNTYKYIIGLLIAQLVGLVIQMIILVKYIASLFQAQIIEKEKMIDRERASRDDKDRKADEWKERFIELVSGFKVNGYTKGQAEADRILKESEKDIKGGQNA